MLDGFYGPDSKTLVFTYWKINNTLIHLNTSGNIKVILNQFLLQRCRSIFSADRWKASEDQMIKSELRKDDCILTWGWHNQLHARKPEMINWLRVLLSRKLIGAAILYFSPGLMSWSVLHLSQQVSLSSLVIQMNVMSPGDSSNLSFIFKPQTQIFCCWSKSCHEFSLLELLDLSSRKNKIDWKLGKGLHDCGIYIFSIQ